MLETLEQDFAQLPELLSSRTRGRGRPGRPGRCSGRAAAPSPSPSPSPNTRSWASLLVPTTPRRLAAAVARPAATRATSSTSRASSGAGKTVFVRGACRALGVDRAGHEPDLHDREPVRHAAGRCRHLDLYRSAARPSRSGADLEPYFEGHDLLRRVARGRRGGVLPPRARRRCRLRHVEGDARLIELRSHDAEPARRALRLILSFDTATDVATACSSADGEVLGRAATRARSTVLERRSTTLLRATRASRRRTLDAIVVGTGPGTLHGPADRPRDRPGARLALGIPVRGVSTLDALATGAPGASPASTRAAARCSCAGAGIEPQAPRPRADVPRPPGAVVVGDGAVRYRDVLEAAGAVDPARRLAAARPARPLTTRRCALDRAGRARRAALPRGCPTREPRGDDRRRVASARPRAT